MAAAADLITLQQQIRQEMADSLQRLREELHTAISGRLDAISSISSAMQRLSAGPAETTKPYRISGLMPKSRDGSHDKGQFRIFIVQSRVSEILVRVESVDKVQRSTLDVDCKEADFRTVEAALHQILHTGRRQTNH